jgi:hypothetical protein
MMQPNMQPQMGGNYQHASPQQKTMVAQPSPFAGGGQPGMPQSGLAPAGTGGYQQASPMQKTIVGGMAPPISGGQMMQPGMQPNMYPGVQPGMQPGMPPMGPGGQPSPNKTMLLQPSEGVVSVARTGQAVQPANQGAGMMQQGMMQQGASTAFWIVSLFIGIAIGVLAYVIALQV